MLRGNIPRRLIHGYSLSAASNYFYKSTQQLNSIWTFGYLVVELNPGYSFCFFLCFFLSTYASMKDHSHQQDAWTGIALDRPDLAAHYHSVTRSKRSPGARDGKIPHGDHSARKHSWPFFTNERASLASVSTDRQPLVRSDTDAASLITESTLSFTERYGRCLEILHYGSSSTTRLHENKRSLSASPQLLAIKIYRYSILDFPNTHSRTCPSISISDLHPHHPNILQITDLLYNERSELCLVMPFCEGGDLHELLSRHGPLPSNEADCITAQILRALSFLHEHETAHRDVRLETILLTANGAVKLAGFGDGHIRRIWNECTIPLPAETEEEALQQRSQSQPSSWSFSLPWLLSPFKSHERTIRGPGDFSSSSASFPGMSLPFIPPEVFRYRSRHSQQENDEYDNDPRPADVWSTAIVYLVLINGRLPWRSTRPHREDERYLEYLRGRVGEDGYPPIEALGSVSSGNYPRYAKANFMFQRRRNAIYAMLNPNPRKRITTTAMLGSEWMDGVAVCEAGELGC